jgi:hypothetical protein
VTGVVGGVKRGEEGGSHFLLESATTWKLNPGVIMLPFFFLGPDNYLLKRRSYVTNHQ